MRVFSKDLQRYAMQKHSTSKKYGDRHRICVNADEWPKTRTRTKTGDPETTAPTPIVIPNVCGDNFMPTQRTGSCSVLIFFYPRVAHRFCCDSRQLLFIIYKLCMCCFCGIGIVLISHSRILIIIIIIDNIIII